jgi:hypothetical protein
MLYTRTRFKEKKRNVEKTGIILVLKKEAQILWFEN